MRRVDRVRAEKRRRLLLTAGLAFTLGALTAGILIWRIDHLAALADVEADAKPRAEIAVGPAEEPQRPPAPVATAKLRDGPAAVLRKLIG